MIGVEFASAWRSFGVDVTIVEALPRLVSGEDPSISTALETGFSQTQDQRDHGCRHVGDARPLSPAYAWSLRTGKQLEAELMLVAVGRGPQTTGLGYQEAGVDLEDGFVRVNERLETSVPGVYAVGRRGAWPAARASGLRARHLRRRGDRARTGVLEHPPTPIVDLQIPRVTYCDPEIASVGLTEDEARTRFGDVETFSYDLAGNGKSQILKTRGFVKLVRQAERSGRRQST